MAGRYASDLSGHDKAVADYADMLVNKGYEVYADVPGYTRPDVIRNPGSTECRRPDIVAIKDGLIEIIEVETADSYDEDRGQRKVFRDYANRHENTSFRTVTI